MLQPKHSHKSGHKEFGRAPLRSLIGGETLAVGRKHQGVTRSGHPIITVIKLRGRKRGKALQGQFDLARHFRRGRAGHNRNLPHKKTVVGQQRHPRGGGD